MKKGESKPLEEVCNVEYGTRVVQKRDGGKGFPVYGGGGATFEMDGFNREDRLVVARFGMSEECTRFVAGKFFLNDSGLTVSPKNGKMLQRFLDYQMLALNDDIYALGKGTAQKNLDVPVFRTMPLFVPNELAEQQRIVGLLDEAFEGLATAKANAEKNPQNARALFESHLQSVFTQRGPGWVEKNLGDLCQIKTGTKDVNEGNPEGKYPFFTCAAAHTFSDNYSFDTEALLVAGNGNVGQVSYYSGKFEAYQRTYVLFDFKGVTARYLFRVLDKRLSATVSKQKLGNTMPYIKIGMLTDYVVPVPPPKEQEIVAESLSAIAEETQRLARLYERKHAALEALKKSLLHQAFTGEL